MAYYRGDYSGGGYYRGDPFLGFLAKGALKLAAPVLKKVVPFITGQNIKRAAKVATVAAAATPVIRSTMQMDNPTISLPAIAPGGEPFIRSGYGDWPRDKSGKPRRQRQDGKPWKRPTMNPLNPRALKRALRRAEGFSDFSRRVMNALTKPGRVKRFKKSFPTRKR